MYINKITLKHKLITETDFDNNINKQTDIVEQEVNKVYISNTKGYSRMKRYDYCDMQEAIIRSTLDLKIWNYLINTCEKNGYCVNKKREPLMINDIANHFKISRQKVSKFIKRAKEIGFVKVVKRLIYINPYIFMPSVMNDNERYEIQKLWNDINN